MVAGAVTGIAVGVLPAVCGWDTAGVACAETAAGGEATAVGVVALLVVCVTGESDAPVLDADTPGLDTEPDADADAGAVDGVDAAGAAAAAEDVLAPGAVTGAEEPLAARADVLGASPLDPDAFGVELVVDTGARAGVAPALELLFALKPAANADPAADVAAVAAPEPRAGRWRDMLWKEPADLASELWAVAVWALHTRPPGCWLSRVLIRLSMRPPDPIEPGG
ncbi:MAG: hypothetical protein ACR2QA_14300 [Solirubrobacteraceae bacterium]